MILGQKRPIYLYKRSQLNVCITQSGFAEASADQNMFLFIRRQEDEWWQQSPRPFVPSSINTRSVVNWTLQDIYHSTTQGLSMNTVMAPIVLGDSSVIYWRNGESFYVSIAPRCWWVGPKARVDKLVRFKPTKWLTERLRVDTASENKDAKPK